MPSCDEGFLRRSVREAASWGVRVHLPHVDPFDALQALYSYHGLLPEHLERGVSWARSYGPSEGAVVGYEMKRHWAFGLLDVRLTLANGQQASLVELPPKTPVIFP